MGNQEAAAEFLRQGANQFSQRDPGSIRADDNRILEIGSDIAKDFFLNVQPFGHRFQNPVGVFQ